MMQVLLHFLHVSSNDSKNLLVQSTKDKPRNKKIVLGGNSPTATGHSMEDPPGTRSGRRGFLVVLHREIIV